MGTITKLMPISQRPINKSVCRLLFLGVDWTRKGGELAFEIAGELNRQGLKTELTVVGCTPQLSMPMPPFVRVIGYVSKASREGADLINQQLATSHFVILPSRAEAAAVVVAEASSYGLPSITSDVGGLPTLVRDEIHW